MALTQDHFLGGRRHLWLLNCSLVLAATGCLGAKTPDPVGPVVPVAGKITLGGRPFTRGAVVSFVPDPVKGNTSLFQATGAVDFDGNYQMGTFGKTGVPPGWYKVGIRGIRLRNPGNPKGPPITAFPTAYGDPQTSGLRVEVVASPVTGAYDFNIR